MEVGGRGVRNEKGKGERWSKGRLFEGYLRGSKPFFTSDSR